MIAIKGGKFVDPGPTTMTLLFELKTRVKAEGGDWEVYRQEMKRILRSMRSQFRAEGLTLADRKDQFIRLSDGKNLLLGLRKAYTHTPAEGLLADALTAPPYADKFREELLALTKAARGVTAEVAGVSDQEWGPIHHLTSTIRQSTNVRSWRQPD